VNNGTIIKDVRKEPEVEVVWEKERRDGAHDYMPSLGVLRAVASSSPAMSLFFPSLLS
jgi:hypothetical protein